MDFIKIVLVEDQHLFREGMCAMLNKETDIKIMSDHEDGKSFLEWLSSQKELPDIVLLDLNLPKLNGIELTDVLQTQYPSIKIIILTIYNQPRFVSKMVAMGVSGYLMKNSDIQEVVQAIRIVNKTGFYFNESTVHAMRDGYKYKDKSNRIHTLHNLPVEISDRETEILNLICSEYTNAEIAEKLHISPRTVDGHRNNLLAKTSSRNTAGLVIFAIANNLFDVVFGSGRKGEG